ncbi:MAG: glyceraldehyde 3-phosphate dehydrogenase NAD-binding domain-containing protein, partial [Arenibacter sp.]
MKQINIGINGFGRIGRTLYRLLSEQAHLRVVAINDLADAPTLSHLLKYDSIHGVFQKEVSHSGENIIVDNNKVAL